MAKCKRLKKQLKLKEEIAGLDPNVIIESKEDDGRPKRSTRRATRRSFVFDEPLNTKNQQQSPSQNIENTPQLLQKMKEVVDSDSEYDGDQHNQNSNNVDSANMLDTIISSNDMDALSEQILTVQSMQELLPVEIAVDTTLVNAQCTTPLRPL